MTCVLECFYVSVCVDVSACMYHTMIKDRKWDAAVGASWHWLRTQCEFFRGLQNDDKANSGREGMCTCMRTLPSMPEPLVSTAGTLTVAWYKHVYALRRGLSSRKNLRRDSAGKWSSLSSSRGVDGVCVVP